MTPPRAESPGRLGDDPVLGPPSRFSVEREWYGFRPGIGYTFVEFREAIRQDLEAEDMVNDLLEVHCPDTQ